MEGHAAVSDATAAFVRFSIAAGVMLPLADWSQKEVLLAGDPRFLVNGVSLYKYACTKQRWAKIREICGMLSSRRRCYGQSAFGIAVVSGVIHVRAPQRCLCLQGRGTNFLHALMPRTSMSAWYIHCSPYLEIGYFCTLHMQRHGSKPELIFDATRPSKSLPVKA